MKYPISACFALLLGCSCATLDIREIETLEREQFEPVTLRPAWETHNMRLDVIRQTESTGDSTGTTEETAYNPLGFDLGNGLFYDLNDNLSLRLDQIMDFSPGGPFEVIEVGRPGRRGTTTVYKFENDSLTITNIRRKKPRYISHLSIDGDSVRYMRRQRMKYAIVETDTSLVYTGKRRKRNAIYEIDANRYYRDKERRRNLYELTGDGAMLGRKYRVNAADDNRRIVISERRKKKDKLIYTMVRDENTVFLYKKDFSGLKLERRRDGLDFTINRRLATHYEVK